MNFATGTDASVMGGTLNYSTGFDSSITGGLGNEAEGVLTSVTGGYGNRASGGSLIPSRRGSGTRLEDQLVAGGTTSQAATTHL